MKPVKNVNVSDDYKEDDYQDLLYETIAVIESSRLRIAKQVNTAVMSSHWEIGRLLEERKLDSKHGDNIVKRLSVDLKKRFPNMGVSPRNLWDMKRFYLRYYQEDIKLQRCVVVLYLLDNNEDRIVSHSKDCLEILPCWEISSSDQRIIF